MSRNGTRVTTNDVTRAADKMKAAAEMAGKADPSGDLDGITSALPKSQSADVVTGLGTAWEKRFSKWQGDAKGHGQDMAAAADTYDAADAGATARQNRLEAMLR